MVRPSWRAHQCLDTGCRLPSRHGGKNSYGILFFPVLGIRSALIMMGVRAKVTRTKIEKKEEISCLEVLDVFVLDLKIGFS